ncbi:MAG: WecB/TagA/CpsF family glycosyltransferase, partial [Phycisphaerae bacterium]
MPLPTVTLFDIPIAVADMPAVLDLCEQRMRDRSSLLIGVVNAAKIVNMRRNPQLRDSVLSADVIFADGMSVVWASRFLGK